MRILFAVLILFGMIVLLVGAFPDAPAVRQGFAISPLRVVAGGLI